MSDSFPLHGLQHTKFPCPSLSHGVCLNSCPLSWWRNPTISFSFTPFLGPRSFPASRSFPVSWLFAWGGQSIGASASILLMNIQGWFPFGLTGLISCCPRDTQESSLAPQFKSINSLALSFLYGLTLTSMHTYWKNHSFEYIDLWWQCDVFAF